MDRGRQDAAGPQNTPILNRTCHGLVDSLRCPEDKRALRAALNNCMTAPGHDLPVWQRRTRGRCTPNSCRSHCTAKTFSPVPRPEVSEAIRDAVTLSSGVGHRPESQGLEAICVARALDPGLLTFRNELRAPRPTYLIRVAASLTMERSTCLAMSTLPFTKPSSVVMSRFFCNASRLGSIFGSR